MDDRCWSAKLRGLDYQMPYCFSCWSLLLILRLAPSLSRLSTQNASSLCFDFSLFTTFVHCLLWKGLYSGRVCWSCAGGILSATPAATSSSSNSLARPCRRGFPRLLMFDRGKLIICSVTAASSKAIRSILPWIVSLSRLRLLQKFFLSYCLNLSSLAQISLPLHPEPDPPLPSRQLCLLEIPFHNVLNQIYLPYDLEIALKVQNDGGTTTGPPPDHHRTNTGPTADHDWPRLEITLWDQKLFYVCTYLGHTYVVTVYLPGGE